MIRLRKRSGTDAFVNIDQVAYIEETPDVVLTLINGEKMILLDEVGSIIEKIVCFKARVLRHSLSSTCVGCLETHAPVYSLPNNE